MATKNCKPMPIITPQKVKVFWSHIIKKGPDECWPWTANTTKYGYGLFGVITSRKTGNKYALAHRISYFLETGEDPYPLGVLHRCSGCRGCCNPKHLYLGDDARNVKDRDGQKRFVHNRRVILDAEKAEQIRTYWRGRKYTVPEMAGMYGVRNVTISNVIYNKTWTQKLASKSAGYLCASRASMIHD